LIGADTMTWGTTVGIVLGVPCGLLSVAGVQHVFGRDQRRALGAVEIAGAALAVIALLAPGLLDAAAAFFGALALAFLAYLTWLWHTDRNRSCGCTPFATSVTALSFVPAATVLAAALVGLAAGYARVGYATVDRLLLFGVSAMLGWALLLWPPAAER
jgi:hypothetical protein